MGTAYDATCQQCGHRFEVHEGGGFFFHLLHCDMCGRTKNISFDEVRESAPEDGSETASPFDYETVEAMAGQCRCGGAFRMDAPARCPKCRSSDLKQEPDGNVVMYD